MLRHDVSATAWLVCSVGISRDWFCHVYKLSSHPAEHANNGSFKIYGESISLKFKICTLLCLNCPERVVYVNSSCYLPFQSLSQDQSQQYVIPDLDLNCVARIVTFSILKCELGRHSLIRLIDLIPNSNWASSRENLSSEVREQQRRRPACASAQSDQRLCYSLFGKHHI